jgi:hypothetical protein
MQEVTGTRDGVLVVTGFRAIQPVPKGLSAIEAVQWAKNQGHVAPVIGEVK